MNPVEEYISIIHYRQQNPLTESGELHHIIPKSCGGAKRAKWNLVRLTSEAKQKLREAHLGTHASEETRAKMREAWKRRRVA